MMTSPINIHNSGQTIHLLTGIYSINVLGGWGVEVGNFTFLLRNAKTNEIIEPKGTIWRVQSWEFNKRAKKIMSIDIPRQGEYIIEFKNQNSLKVRWSSLFLIQLLHSPIPNENIEICIG